jgi:hypothetical protein
MSPGGTVTAGSGATSVTSGNNGIPVSTRYVANLNMCVYYLKHMEIVQRKPVVNTINLTLVRSYRDQQRHEVRFKKTAEEPIFNDKDWPRTGQGPFKPSRSTCLPIVEEHGILWTM